MHLYLKSNNMKKLLLILILLFSTLLFACKKPVDDNTKDNKLTFNVSDYQLNDSNNTISFNVICDATKRNDIQYKISYVFYDNNALDNEYIVLKNNESKTVIKGTNKFAYKLALTEDEFLLELHIKIELLSEGFDFSLKEEYVQGIVNLARTYEENTNSLADEIMNAFNGVSEIKVNNIYLNLDYSKKECTPSNNGYTVNAIFDTDEIKVEIAFDSKATSSIDFTLLPIFVNNEELSQKLIKDNDKYYFTLTNYEVKEAKLSFDYLKKTDECNSTKYKATMSNPEYNKITIVLTLNDNYFYSTKFKLYVNEKLVDSSLYSCKDNVITYIFDDPNWSEFY